MASNVTVSGAIMPGVAVKVILVGAGDTRSTTALKALPTSSLEEGRLAFILPASSTVLGVSLSLSKARHLAVPRAQALKCCGTGGWKESHCLYRRPCARTDRLARWLLRTANYRVFFYWSPLSLAKSQSLYEIPYSHLFFSDFTISPGT